MGVVFGYLVYTFVLLLFDMFIRFACLCNSCVKFLLACELLWVLRVYWFFCLVGCLIWFKLTCCLFMLSSIVSDLILFVLIAWVWFVFSCCWGFVTCFDLYLIWLCVVIFIVSVLVMPMLFGVNLGCCFYYCLCDCFVFTVAWVCFFDFSRYICVLSVVYCTYWLIWIGCIYCMLVVCCIVAFELRMV